MTEAERRKGPFQAGMRGAAAAGCSPPSMGFATGKTPAAVRQADRRPCRRDLQTSRRSRASRSPGKKSIMGTSNIV